MVVIHEKSTFPMVDFVSPGCHCGGDGEVVSNYIIFKLFFFPTIFPRIHFELELLHNYLTEGPQSV
jgi:hypothetical protein